MSAEPGPSRQLTNLQLRVLSAVVLIVLVLVPTWAGGVWFRLLAALIGAAMFFEWAQLARASADRRHLAAAGVALAAILVLLVFGGQPVLALAFLVLAVAASAVLGQGTGKGVWPAAGLAYAGLSAICLGILRGVNTAGLTAVLFLFATVWATDIAAYFVGRKFGGPKLAPAISPGKTWSGAIGGAAGGVVAGVALAAAAGAAGLGALAVVAFFLSVVSQVGDLFESWVKRRHGAKDSGSLIPGHGGVMDRVDGLVAAAIALYAIGAFVHSADMPAQGLFAN